MITAHTPPFDYVDKGGAITAGKIVVNSPKPDGGPSKYYDFPFYLWTTVNDMVEYLADKQWGRHSWIFKDILKACTRWGAKEGTDQSYDAKKIIYYGCRLLMSVTNKKVLRDYLQTLLDDNQFQLEDKTVKVYGEVIDQFQEHQRRNK